MRRGRLGIARDRMEAATIAGVPMIGFVAPPADAPALTGEAISKSEIDLTARTPACAIALCSGPRLHVRPDRRRRESEGRRLLSFREAVFAPI